MSLNQVLLLNSGPWVCGSLLFRSYNVLMRFMEVVRKLFR